MSAKHSTGPWCVDPADNPNEPFNIFGDDGQMVGSVWSDQFGGDLSEPDEIAMQNGGVRPDDPNFVSDEEAEANARLIAAAPELQVALQVLVEAFDEGRAWPQGAWDAARRAVLRANGEER